MSALSSILLAAGVAGVFGAATGAALLFVPRRFLEEPRALRRLLLETNIGDVFNRRFTIERRVYRRHRLFGAFVIVGALAGTSLLWIATQNPAVTAALVATLGKIGFRVALTVATALDVLLYLVGVCLLLRPSVLKGIEAAANRWIDPIPGKSSHAVVSRMVLRSPRVAGALLLITGFACLRPF